MDKNVKKSNNVDKYFEDYEDNVNYKNPGPGFNNVKFVDNEHYDMVYDINQSLSQENSEEQVKTRKSLSNYDKEEDSDEEEPPKIDNKNKFNFQENNIRENYTQQLKELPKFDITQFYNLNVDSEQKDLMNLMNRYKVNDLILDTKMKPFIPNYIPSVCEVDAFLKINRPDNLFEDLGLNVMDEPTINGIDKTIFSIELSYKLKTKSNSNMNVKILENACKNPKQIQNWIDQIGELHKEKMSSTVNYSKHMPDIESLLQIWPEKIENSLKEINFPDEKLNIGLDNYAKIICNMLDIPVHKLNSNKGIIESLHVLFTVFLEFKVNQHFQRNNGKSQDNVQSIKFS